MSEAPTVGQIDRSTEKIIQVKKDNNNIFFYLKIKENNLIISTEIKDSLISHFYDTTVSMQDIQKNKYFLQFDTLEEILNELILKSQTKNPILEKDNNIIILRIALNSSKFKDIDFILKEKNKTDNDKFREIFDIVIDIKKENSELKKEINYLKSERIKINEQINDFKEQIKILNDFKNKIEEEEKRQETKKGEELEKLFGNSTILNNSQDKMKIKEFISSEKAIESELKYRMTRDGTSFYTFHSKCDNVSPNLLLIKDNHGDIFGAFTTVSWEKKDCQKIDTNSFLFSLNKNKKYYQKHKDYKTIYCYKDYGPWFYGADISFFKNNMSECKSSGNGDYLDEPLSKNKPNEYFKVQEVEIFKINIL